MVLSKKEIGVLIKKARKHKTAIIGRKYTQNMLAEDLELSRGYIGDVENGRIYPNYVLLNKIAEQCEVPLSFFDSEGKIMKSSTEVEDTINYTEVTGITDVKEAMERIISRPRLMLNGEMLSDESKMALVNAIKMGLVFAEQIQEIRKYMKVTIDRFEGTFAVCEKEDKTMINIKRNDLPKAAKEGDVLEICKGVIVIDMEETKKRREKIEALTKDLWI